MIESTRISYDRHHLLQGVDHSDLTGIGRATAVALSKAGWALGLFARRADKLQETQNLCEHPSKVLLVIGDVVKEEDVQKLFRLTVEKFGEWCL